MNDLNFKIGDYSIEGKHGYESLKAKGYDEEALAELDTNGDKKISHKEFRGVNFRSDQTALENGLTELADDEAGFDDDSFRPHSHKRGKRGERPDGPPPPPNGERPDGPPPEMDGDFDGPPPPQRDGERPDGPPPGDGKRPDKKPDSKPGGDKTPPEFMKDD